MEKSKIAIMMIDRMSNKNICF